MNFLSSPKFLVFYSGVLTVVFATIIPSGAAMQQSASFGIWGIEVLFHYGLNRAQIVRDHRADLVAPPEHTIASACDGLVEHIAQRSRNYLQERRYDFPFSSEATKNMNPSIRAYQQGTVTGLHDHAIGQFRALRNRNAGLERFSSQWGKLERRSRAVLLQDEFHGVVTESAVPIIEENLH